MKIQSNHNPSAAELAFQQARIREMNLTDYGVEQNLSFISYLALDDNGTPIGGVFGHRQLDIFYLEAIWVHPSQRKNGVARKLTEHFLEDAKSVGCKGILTHTVSYTDSGLKIGFGTGFEVAAELTDFPAPYKHTIIFRRL